METFSASLALCAGNSPVTAEFPSQRPVTWSLDVSFDLRLNKRLNKQSRRRWFETLSRLLWRHCNGYVVQISLYTSVQIKAYHPLIIIINFMLLFIQYHLCAVVHPHCSKIRYALFIPFLHGLICLKIVLLSLTLYQYHSYSPWFLWNAIGSLPFKMETLLFEIPVFCSQQNVYFSLGKCFIHYP